MTKIFEYINKSYGVSASKGQKIKMDGRPGTITGVRSAHLLIRFDGYKHSSPVHPTWRMEYLT